MPGSFRLDKSLAILVILLSGFLAVANLTSAQSAPGVGCANIGNIAGPTPICVQWTTSFTQSGTGSFTKQAGASPTAFSPTGQVWVANLGFGPNYLVCPQSASSQPNPTTSFYFDANKAQNIGGDQCLEQTLQLMTTITLPTTVIAPPMETELEELGQAKQVSFATVQALQVQNPGNLYLRMINYSPEVDGMLSNGWNTSSYIFREVPSSPQYAIWSWTAEFANFGSAQQGQSQTYNYPGPLEDEEYYGETCFYSYKYSETTTLQSIKNNYIEYNEVVPPGAGSSSPSSSSLSSSGANGAGSGIFDNGLGTPGISPLIKVPSNTFNLQFQTATSTTDETPIPTGGSCPNMVYPAHTGYNGATLSQAQIFACAAQAGFTGDAEVIIVAIAYAESSGEPGIFAGNPAGQGLWQIDATQNPQYTTSCVYNPTCAAQAAWTLSDDGTSFAAWCTYYNPGSACSSTAYCQYMLAGWPAPGCSGQSTTPPPASPGTGTGTGPSTVSGKNCPNTCFQTSVLPYIYFNYSLNLSSTVSLANPNLTHISESTYSPWNYYTPANSEDPFPLDLPGAFFFNSGQGESGGGTGILSSVLGTSRTAPGVLVTAPLNGLGIDTTPANTLPVNAFIATSSSQTSTLGSIANAFGLGSLFGNTGGINAQVLTSQPINNPISITSTPNDYIYVLYQGISGNYDIAVIRLYPKGYYNASNLAAPLPPMTNQVLCASSNSQQCATKWNNAWYNYWDEVTTEQNNRAYLVCILPLSQAASAQGTAAINAPCAAPSIAQLSPYDGGNVLQNDSAIYAPINNSDGIENLGNNASLSNGGAIAKSPPLEFQTPTTAGSNSCSTAACAQGADSPTCPSGTVIEGESCVELTSGITFCPTSCPCPLIATTDGCVVATSSTTSGTTGGVTVQSGVQPGFKPYAIGADDEGNLFIIGSGSPSTLVKIANVLVNGGLCSSSNPGGCDIIESVQLPTSYSEIAVSPELGNIYLTSPFLTGEIDVYDAAALFGGTAQSTSPDTEINLAYGANLGAQQQSTQFFGPSASGAPVLNIAYWLQQGGLFGIPIQPASGTAIGDPSNMDCKSDHFPLAMADISGYLYVLDDWTGTIGGGSSTGCGASSSSNAAGGGTQFNILVLRALNSTGTDVPLNPTIFNDVFGQSTAAAQGSSSSTTSTDQIEGGFSLAAAGLFQNNTYPPYGWILSAAVGSQNFCSDSSQGCTNNPQSLSNKAYFPIGPKLVSNVGCTQGFLQGEATSNCAAGVGFSVSTNGTIALFLPMGSDYQYSEMIIGDFGVENYTKPLQNTPPYTCYEVGSSSPSTGAGTACLSDPAMNYIQAPIYYVNDPFKYLENVGAEKVFTFGNQFNSEFSGGGGGSPAATGGYSQACQTQTGNLQAATNCAQTQGSSTSTAPIGSAVSQAYNINPASTAQNTIANTPILTSSISGFAYIPYQYTYQLAQSWSGFSLIGGGSVCPGSIPGFSNTITQTVYSYAVTPNAITPGMSANVEGGDTYLQYEGGGSNSWYVQNLSDYGLYLSQHLLINVTNDRKFGLIYVANASYGSNNYNLLNATQQLQYVIDTWTDQGLSYETINSEAITPPDYGPTYSQTQLQSQSIPANFVFNESLSNPPNFGTVLLFDWYKQEVYQSPLDLYAPTISGYQRMLYVLNDRFNNTIYAPIDVDIANITQLTMTVNPVVNFTNPNSTTLNINGSVGYFNYNGFDTTNSYWVPLQQGNVYLYYGEDLNYNGLTTQQAQLCAFGSPNYPFNTVPYPNCQQSNPEYTALQNGAGTINYMTSNSGTCPAPPNSLLYGTTLTCNIYGNDGNSQTTTQLQPTCSGSGEYCVPIYANGSGTCTSEAGLMDIAAVNSLGEYSYNTIACGIGQAKILAKFYGAPTSPLEPIQVYQGPLTSAANAVRGSQGSTTTSTPFNAIGFTWAPNETVVITSIGLFELSFGDIGMIGVVAAIAAALLVLVYRRNKAVKK